MNSEEKVKAYDEALKRAKEAAEKGVVSHNFVSDIFHELAESKDEIIRKEILNVFKQLDKDSTICGRNYDYANWVAWLEKQGEQNPAWSEEDKFMIQDTIHWIKEFQKSNRCKDENDMQNSVTCEEWLKSLKKRIQQP